MTGLVTSSNKAFRPKRKPYNRQTTLALFAALMRTRGSSPSRLNTSDSYSAAGFSFPGGLTVSNRIRVFKWEMASLKASSQLVSSQNAIVLSLLLFIAFEVTKIRCLFFRFGKYVIWPWVSSINPVNDVVGVSERKPPCHAKNGTKGVWSGDPCNFLLRALHFDDISFVLQPLSPKSSPDKGLSLTR